jgi:hypothetical protein
VLVIGVGPQTVVVGILLLMLCTMQSVPTGESEERAATSLSRCDAIGRRPSVVIMPRHVGARGISSRRQLATNGSPRARAPRHAPRREPPASP